MLNIFGRLELKVNSAFISLAWMWKVNLGVSISQWNRCTKTIWNYVEMLKTYKFAFDILELGCADNYTLDENGKTALLERYL